MENQAKTLFERVADYLNAQDWTYSAFDDKGYFSFNLRLNEEAVRVVVDTVQAPGWSRLLVYAQYPVFVPASRRPAVSEAINRINYATTFGNLEMDANDGEIRVRTALEGDAFFGERMIDRAVRQSLELANRYFAPILALAFGNGVADDVLEMVSRGDAATLQ